jgi:hypothetical protein
VCFRVKGYIYKKKVIYWHLQQWKEEKTGALLDLLFKVVPVSDF